MSTVDEELAPLVRALRGAIGWHIETGDAALPVPADFVLPPLGMIEPEAPITREPVAVSEAPAPTAPSFRPDPTPEQAAAAPAPSTPIAQPSSGDLPPLMLWGNPWGRVAFVLEAGSSETPVQSDAATPLGGEAGTLLMRMIKAMKLPWSDVFLVGCVRGATAPPAHHWRPAIERMLSMAPRAAIVSMGVTPTHAILETDDAMPRLRGRAWKRADGTPVFPTFTPDALVQNKQLKAEAWTDLQRVMRALEPPKVPKAPKTEPE